MNNAWIDKNTIEEIANMERNNLEKIGMFKIQLA